MEIAALFKRVGTVAINWIIGHACFIRKQSEKLHPGPTGVMVRYPDVES